MTLEELNDLTCNETSLDDSESAIIKAFRQSGLEGVLFAIQYGSGGITFRTLDNQEFYVMLEKEFDERGYEISRKRTCLYRLINKHQDYSEFLPPVKSLKEIFEEINLCVKK